MSAKYFGKKLNRGITLLEMTIAIGIASIAILGAVKAVSYYGDTLSAISIRMDAEDVRHLVRMQLSCKVTKERNYELCTGAETQVFLYNTLGKSFKTIDKSLVGKCRNQGGEFDVYYKGKPLFILPLSC